MVVNLIKLESTYHFTYSKHLVFEDVLFEQALKKACLEKPIDPKAKLHGLRYTEELSLGLEASSEICWVHEEVGYGLYSAEDLPQGSFIGEYTGLVGPNTPYYKISNYCFNYPIIETHKALSIDAEAYGNLTRFINHSFTPNLDILYAFHGDLYHVILTANRPIQKGEQFTFNYGHSYWYLRGAPYEGSS